MGTIIALLVMALAAFVALPAGGVLTSLFGWYAHPWAAPALLFLAIFITISAVLGSIGAVLSLAGGGLWSTSPVRWTVGKLAFLVLMVPVVACLAVFDHYTGHAWYGVLGGIFTVGLLDPVGAFVPFMGTVDPSASAVVRFLQSTVVPLIRLFMLVVLVQMVRGFVRMEKPWAARLTLPVRNIWRALKTGLGGSSGFDGIMDEWLMPWQPGQIILGTSMYEPGQRVGITDDRHLLTIATTRAGKGRSCIIPNLLVYPGSALVIDPKAENAAVTARARARLGQRVFILDPFSVTAKLGLDPTLFETHRFNPLAAVGVNDGDVVEQIGNLADALINKSQNANPFWDEAAKSVLVGLIAHVMTWPKLDDSERHLGTVRDYVTETRGRKLADLADSPGAGNLTMIARAELRRAAGAKGQSEMLNSIFTTLSVHTKWLDSPAMRHALSASDFDINTLKSQGATLYLVIPQKYLVEHARFLRLFITVAMQAATSTVGARHSMLFILDEFATLGNLKVVEQAAGLMAGSGVRLWPIIQNITQLRQYGENWETFISNASQVQFFAANDASSADYFSKKLDRHMAWKKHAGEWVPQGATWFRTAAELARDTSRDSGRVAVFFEGGRQALLSRGPYDKMFSFGEYDLNPWLRGGPTRMQRFQAWLHDEDIPDLKPRPAASTPEAEAEAEPAIDLDWANIFEDAMAPGDDEPTQEEQPKRKRPPPGPGPKRPRARRPKMDREQGPSI